MKWPVSRLRHSECIKGQSKDTPFTEIMSLQMIAERRGCRNKGMYAAASLHMGKAASPDKVFRGYPARAVPACPDKGEKGNGILV